MTDLHFQGQTSNGPGKKTVKFCRNNFKDQLSNRPTCVDRILRKQEQNQKILLLFDAVKWMKNGKFNLLRAMQICKGSL